MEPHLARHGVQVQRGHVRWAGGGASSIMSLAMLLLGLKDVRMEHFEEGGEGGIAEEDHPPLHEK